QMPVMDGYTATREIRKNDEHRDTPILSLTANVSPEDKRLADEAGMNDHLAKPIDPEEMFRKLLDWIKPGERDLSKLLKVGGEEHISALPDLPGIDTQMGLLRMGGNPFAYRQLLRKFSCNQGAAVTRIRSALEHGKFEAAIDNVHTHKEIEGNIGAQELFIQARQLEKRLKEGDRARWKEPLEELRENHEYILTVICDNIDRYASEYERPGNKTEDRNVEAILRELGEKIGQHDSEAVDILERLMAQIDRSSAAGELEVLGKMIGDYDFGAAADQFESLCAKLGLASGK
ncbi:MAG: response regulator, partial [Planctomycetes bacterium]|nr:response regulator [Planctomycetota bacterium]